MGALTPILGIVGMGLQVVGTMQAAEGAREEGREQKRRFEYEQKVREQQADEAVASSQRDAIERGREGRYLLSQQQAAIAASGGSLEDPSVIKIMDETRDRVGYAVDSEMFKGEQQKRGYKDAAEVAGYDAQAAMRAAKMKANGILISGFSSMFSRFGQSNMGAGQTASSVPLPYG